MDRKAMAVEASSVGVDVAADFFRTNLNVETKRSEIDYVTEADTLTQRRIIEAIGDHYPDDTIVGEEEHERKAVPSDEVRG